MTTYKLLTMGIRSHGNGSLQHADTWRKFFVLTPSEPITIPDYRVDPCAYDRLLDTIGQQLSNLGACLHATYSGPGAYFQDEPVIYMLGRRIILTQYCGYDV